MAGEARFGQIGEADFSQLLQALSATTKGRSFLAEYRRRCRPDDDSALFTALERIERSMASVRDQLRPERIADELRRIAMTLEVATAGLDARGDANEFARRTELVDHARTELAALAAGLAAGPAGPERRTGRPSVGHGRTGRPA
jgi:hypothetical protein